MMTNTYKIARLRLYFLYSVVLLSLLSCNNSTQWVNKAEKEYNNRDYTTAIESYTKAIEIDPKNSVAYVGRGNCYDILQRKQEALNDYENSLKLSPNNEFAYYNRGVLYSSIKKYKLAIDDFTSAIKIYPNYEQAFYQRGICYYLRGNREKAINDLEDAVRINPSYSQAIKSLNAMRTQ